MTLTSPQIRLLNYSACAGIGTMLVGLAMVFVFPVTAELPAGYTTPIIAFEFAASQSDLGYLTGNGSTEIANRAAMAAGLKIDMLFPFFYAGFLLMLLARLAAQGHKIAILGVPFALAIVPLDIRENLTLLAIIRHWAEVGALDALLIDLRTDTWLKWGAIGVAAGFLALAYAKNKEFKSAAISMLAAVSIAGCWASGTAPVLAEIMSLSVLIFFVALTVKECRLLLANRR